ncbi:hypothetical protein MTR_8g037300 [Medicago truncatula]|uniref:Uncharacterized protein n=1 Tax=Medicago truncatula TaxID=3880 RepID=A0A072TPE7_MEDTR|nr:hypothetical protein MTR_8g037300 [Medicago truncatula]
MEREKGREMIRTSFFRFSFLSSSLSIHNFQIMKIKKKPRKSLDSNPLIHKPFIHGFAEEHDIDEEDM